MDNKRSKDLQGIIGACMLTIVLPSSGNTSKMVSTDDHHPMRTPLMRTPIKVNDKSHGNSSHTSLPKVLSSSQNKLPRHDYDILRDNKKHVKENYEKIRDHHSTLFNTEESQTSPNHSIFDRNPSESRKIRTIFRRVNKGIEHQHNMESLQRNTVANLKLVTNRSPNLLFNLPSQEHLKISRLQRCLQPSKWFEENQGNGANTELSSLQEYRKDAFLTAFQNEELMIPKPNVVNKRDTQQYKIYKKRSGMHKVQIFPIGYKIPDSVDIYSHKRPKGILPQIGSKLS